MLRASGNHQMIAMSPGSIMRSPVGSSNWSGPLHFLSVHVLSSSSLKYMRRMLHFVRERRARRLRVGEGCGRSRPRAGVAAGIGVATAQSMSSDKGDNLLVVEALSVENVANVLHCVRGAALVGGRKATIRRASFAVSSVVTPTAP